MRGTPAEPRLGLAPPEALPQGLKWVLAAAGLRAVATSAVGIMITIHLVARGLTLAQAGIVLTAGLLGNFAGLALLPALSRRAGVVRLQVYLSLVAMVGGVVIAFARGEGAIVPAAMFGMINAVGRDRGPLAAVDQALLAQLAAGPRRTFVFALHSVTQDIGHALGALFAGLPSLLHPAAHAAPQAAPGTLMVAALLVGLAGLCYTRARVTAVAPRPGPLTPAARRILFGISALFGLDAVAGGLLATSTLAFFFFHRFGASPGVIGLLFAAARLANAGSHMAAAWLAGRIGLVNTMVFTHLPSSLLLMTVPFAPTFPIAAALFLVRESLVEMDVPTRNSYLMAVMAPPERAVAASVTSLVRLGGWALGPALAGLMLGRSTPGGSMLAVPIVAGAAMKVLYDLLLWARFRNVRPPEERAGSGSG